MPKKVLSVLAAAPLALALTACGGDSDATESDAKASVPAGVAAQYATLEKEIAAEGGETESGEWRIGYIVEPAEPWHVMSGKGHEGHQYRPAKDDETHHIEIIPFEKSTGRVVPNVPITVEVVAEDGTVVDKDELNFYYAEFFHYANNFSIPEEGTYTIRATIEAPDFPRHGEKGDTPPLSEGAKVEFEGVELVQE